MEKTVLLIKCTYMALHLHSPVRCVALLEVLILICDTVDLVS